MTPSPVSGVSTPAGEWSALREELAASNLQRMWWLLLTSTSLSLLLAVFNFLQMRQIRFLPSHAFDLGGSAIFLVLIWLARRGALPPLARWALSPAYFAFWLLLMDSYYFKALPLFGETATYVVGAVTPAILILLPPRIFLSLLLPNHVLFCAILLTSESVNKGRSVEDLYGSLINGSLGVLIASLAGWFLFAAKRKNFRYVRLVNERTRDARLAETNLRAILENIPFQAWLKDVHGKYLSVNREFARSHGLTAEEIVGKSMDDLYPASRSAQYFAEDEEVMRTGRQAHYEQTLEEPDGRRWYEVFKSPVIDEGVLMGIAGLARDITNRKAMEEQLVAADKAKSEFLAVMSHEIRTPMNSVLGYAHILSEMPLDPLQREHVESIIASGQLLLTIISDILDFSKIEAGKIAIESEPLRLDDLIARMSRMFQPLAAPKGLALCVTIDDDVPKIIRSDFHRIEQILVNLLSNAVKFTERGSVELHVSVGPRADGGDVRRIRFRVTDTGIGITQEQMEVLFKPFSQADSTIARRFSGTGLGLVIARRLSELMGGTIEVQSTPGNGSTFFVVIRVAVPENQSELPGDKTLASVPEGAPDLSSLRVLIVEDNAPNRKLVSSLLRQWGIASVIATSGREAIRATEEAPYDVILMDVQMPGMDGFEAARRIRDWERSHPDRRKSWIFALTALATTDDKARCLEAGMDDYLTKPLNPEALRKALLRAVPQNPS